MEVTAGRWLPGFCVCALDCVSHSLKGFLCSCHATLHNLCSDSSLHVSAVSLWMWTLLRDQFLLFFSSPWAVLLLVFDENWSALPHYSSMRTLSLCEPCSDFLTCLCMCVNVFLLSRYTWDPLKLCVYWVNEVIFLLWKTQLWLTQLQPFFGF